MGWTTPRSWSVGEVPTAANFNTHLRDNLNALDDRGYVEVYRNSAATHTSNGNWQVIDFNDEYLDSNGFHDNATNPSRITVPTGFGGIYWVFGSVAFAATTGAIGAKVQKNGGDAFASLTQGVSLNGTSVNIGQLLNLAAGDYVELFGYQASGGNLAYNVSASGAAVFFGAFRRPPG